MTERRNLPIGIQTFEEIRKKKCVYVDKTEYIYKLSYGGGKTYFLSRPRRFGKSLLLSTMRYYFEGRKKLFEGLKIAQLETEWIKYPVINISFGRNSYEMSGSLETIIDLILWEKESEFCLNENHLEKLNFAVRFQVLIEKMFKSTGKQVVVLVDEYDKPILDALYTENEEKHRQILRNFYGTLKDSDQYLKFIFITDFIRSIKISFTKVTSKKPV